MPELLTIGMFPKRFGDLFQSRLMETQSYRTISLFSAWRTVLHWNEHLQEGKVKMKLTRSWKLNVDSIYIFNLRSWKPSPFTFPKCFHNIHHDSYPSRSTFFQAFDRGMCTSPACANDYAQHGSLTSVSFKTNCESEVVAFWMEIFGGNFTDRFFLIG